jgi:hypothetical protein
MANLQETEVLFVTTPLSFTLFAHAVLVETVFIFLE